MGVLSVFRSPALLFWGAAAACAAAGLLAAASAGPLAPAQPAAVPVAVAASASAAVADHAQWALVAGHSRAEVAQWADDARRLESEAAQAWDGTATSRGSAIAEQFRAAAVRASVLETVADAPGPPEELDRARAGALTSLFDAARAAGQQTPAGLEAPGERQ